MLCSITIGVGSGRGVGGGLMSTIGFGSGTVCGGFSYSVWLIGVLCSTILGSIGAI